MATAILLVVVPASVRPGPGSFDGVVRARQALVVSRAPLATLGPLDSLDSLDPAPQPASGPILVMPFEVVEREPRIYWLGEGAAILLADALEARGGTVITRSERVRAFERVQLPRPASLSRAMVIRVAQLVGASEVVVGGLDLAGEELVARARRVRLDAGRLEVEIIERGPLLELFALFDRLAARLAPGIDAATAPRDGPSLEAFEHFVKGLVSPTPETRVRLLERALALHPQYEGVKLALWEVHNDQGDHQRALAAALGVPAGSRVARRAQFAAALSRIELKQHDEAFVALSALAQEQPAATVYNNLGIVQLRRGSTPQTGRPTYFFSKASEMDPDDPDYFFNLGYAYCFDRDLPAAVYWLREAVRRNPADGDAHFVLGAALDASGSTVEAARERELARRLSSQYAEWEKRRPLPGGDLVPRGFERLKTDLDTPRAQRLERVIVTAAQREHDELAAFHLERARRLFAGETDREALAELRRSIYLSPYQAEAHWLVGRIHLRAGRVGDAIDALTISLWSEETVAAHLALAEAHLQAGDAASARAEVERALALDPESEDAKRLLARLPPVGAR